MIDQSLSPMTSLPISLCMIVKNEARLIKQCLESVKELVRQMVIVDTGSSDDTVRLAKEAGAEVYHHPWEGHFSIARNHSLRYATQPWILILDGDEILPSDAAETLRSLELGTEGPEAYEFTIVNFTTDRADERESSLQHQVRLFKRSVNHGYAGLIHNQLLHLKEQRPLQHHTSVVRVLHYGYTPSVWAQQRKDERLSMLEAAAEAEPHHPFHFYNLGNHLKILKRYTQALEAFRRALSSEETIHAEWMPIACCSAAFCAQSAGLPEEAIELADYALRHDPTLIDAHVRAAEAELKLHRYQACIDRLMQVLLDPNRHAIKLISLHFYAPYRLGRALWLNKRPWEALPFFLSLIPGSQDVTVFTHGVLCAWQTREPKLARYLFTLGKQLCPDDPDWPQIDALLTQKLEESCPTWSYQVFNLPLLARINLKGTQKNLWDALHQKKQDEVFEQFIDHWSPSYAHQALQHTLPLEDLPALQVLDQSSPLPMGLIWLIELDAICARLFLYVDQEQVLSYPVSIPIAMHQEAEERIWGPVVLYSLMKLFAVQLS